jgi:archaellum component FlaC
MTPEQMEKAIEFILNQQAKNEQEIAQLTANVSNISGQIGHISDQIGRVSKQTESISEQVERISEQMERGWEEMREGFNALTGGLLETKRLAEQVAELNIHTSKRVTAIEKKIKNGKKSK